jgi:hypothetical protein
MEILDELLKFKDNKDKYSYTILTHDYLNDEFIETMKNKLENINKKIKNSFSKKHINDRLYSFITYLESNFQLTEKVNGIFLIDSKVNFIPFSKDNIKFCNHWCISKFIMDHGEEFNIDFLFELLSTNFIKKVFKFDKSSYTVVEMDSTKSRNIESHSSTDESSVLEICAKHTPLIICGQNQALKKFTNIENNGIMIVQKNLVNSEIIELINEKEIKDNQIKFKKEFLDKISNPNEHDKLIFGRNEVGEAILNFMVKKIFVNPKILKLLKEKVDASTLNFEINVIRSLESGDYGQTLNKDYGGIVGIKYYT